MYREIEVNKREIEDMLNRLIAENMDQDDKYMAADYIIENVIEIIEKLGGYGPKQYEVIDAKVQ